MAPTSLDLCRFAAAVAAAVLVQLNSVAEGTESAALRDVRQPADGRRWQVARPDFTRFDWHWPKLADRAVVAATSRVDRAVWSVTVPRDGDESGGSWPVPASVLAKAGERMLDVTVTFYAGEARHSSLSGRVVFLPEAITVVPEAADEWNPRGHEVRLVPHDPAWATGAETAALVFAPGAAAAVTNSVAVGGGWEPFDAHAMLKASGLGAGAFTLSLDYDGETVFSKSLSNAALGCVLIVR